MKVLKYWKPLLISIVIFYGSITSGDNLNKVEFLNIKNLDKVVHFIFYLSLSITTLSALYKNSRFRFLDQKLLTIIFVVSYGLIMEMLQYYIASNRSAEIIDAIANTLGCLSGIWLFTYLIKFRLIKYL